MYLFSDLFSFCFYFIMKNYNFVYVVRKQCNDEIFLFIYMFHLGHLLAKLLGISLTPMIYDAAFLLAHDKDVQH